MSGEINDRFRDNVGGIESDGGQSLILPVDYSEPGQAKFTVGQKDSADTVLATLEHIGSTRAMEDNSRRDEVIEQMMHAMLDGLTSEARISVLTWSVDQGVLVDVGMFLPKNYAACSLKDITEQLTRGPGEDSEVFFLSVFAGTVDAVGLPEAEYSVRHDGEATTLDEFNLAVAAMVAEELGGPGE